MRLKKTLFLITMNISLMQALQSLASETPEPLPSVLCEIVGHPTFKNTIVFGSGNRELFLIEENREKTHLHYKDFELSMSQKGYAATDVKSGEILLSITSDENSFVKIRDPLPTDYEIKNCIPISG